MEIFNTILFAASLMKPTTIQILLIKCKQSLLITFQSWIRSSISLTTVHNIIRIEKTLLICVIIRKISIWMLYGYSLQLVMASHHAMVLGDLLNVMLRNIVYKDPYITKFWATTQCLIYCVREILSITFFGVSQEEMVNVCVNLEDPFAESKTVPVTRNSHHLVPISCDKIAHKLTSEDREFLQFDFDKSLTKEMDIKNIKCFLYVSCIYDTFWCVGKVTEVNVHEGDLKMQFLHPHRPRKNFTGPSVADKGFVTASNILCVIAAPTAVTGRVYRISDTDFEQTLKAYENHKM